MKALSIILLGVVGLTSVQTYAMNTQLELDKCVSIEDSLKRLVCYDTLAKKNNPVVIKAVETAVVEKEKAASVVKEVEVINLQESFGAERKYIKKQQVDEVEFVIKSVTKTVRGKLIVTFENGQVWQQKDNDVYANFAPGNTVIVKRGVFDSFYMKKPNVNRTIRVKRIK